MIEDGKWEQSKLRGSNCIQVSNHSGRIGEEVCILLGSAVMRNYCVGTLLPSLYPANHGGSIPQGTKSSSCSNSDSRLPFLPNHFLPLSAPLRVVQNCPLAPRSGVGLSLCASPSSRGNNRASHGIGSFLMNDLIGGRDLVDSAGCCGGSVMIMCGMSTSDELSCGVLGMCEIALLAMEVGAAEDAE